MEQNKNNVHVLPQRWRGVLRWSATTRAPASPRSVATTSAPAQRRGDVGEKRLDDMRIVGDAQLIGDGDKQRVGLCDGIILLQQFDQGIRLGRIAAAEDRPGVFVDEADLVFFVPGFPK